MCSQLNRLTTRVGAFFLVVICLLTAQPVRAACNMVQDYVAKGSIPVWRSTVGAKSFYFRENADVNTDGSARSYHADDLGATSGLAQNTICNGVSRLAGGETVDCLSSTNCKACKDLFKSKPRAEMLSHFSKYFSSFAIAKKNGGACVVSAGQPNAGFFVSTTTYEQTNLDVCDPARYLDAMTFPAIAVPKKLALAGVKMGDYVLVRNRQNGRSAFGVVYDTSGSRIGEGSIAMNRQLLCQTGKPGCEPPKMPTTLHESYALQVSDADYLIFAGTVQSWPKSADAIAHGAGALFKDWGGQSRLDECAAMYSGH